MRCYVFAVFIVCWLIVQIAYFYLFNIIRIKYVRFVALIRLCVAFNNIRMCLGHVHRIGLRKSSIRRMAWAREFPMFNFWSCVSIALCNFRNLLSLIHFGPISIQTDKYCHKCIFFCHDSKFARF